MAALSDYMEDLIINFMRNVAITGHVAAFVALFNNADGTLESDSPTGEVTGANYTRELAGLIDPVTPGVSHNLADITFPTAGAGGWGTVTHVALVDHETNDTWGTNVHVLMWAALDASKDVAEGDTFKINAEELDATIA